jgi:branched-chain amino acid transport system substrate-binding protein
MAKLRSLKLSLGAALALLTAGPALAQESIKFALCYDLSKAYTFITPQVAQAARDYADLVNLGGGIEGRKVEIVVQDHGNEPQRGIECYERTTREGAMVVPRAMKDGKIMVQALVGRGDAIDGEVFRWIFPVGPTYWGQAANIVSYIKKQSKDVKKAKIAFLYIDYPFGQEPIPVLEALQKKEGFDLKLFPFPLPGNDQSSAWSQIRRYQPDYVIMWGFSAMHVVASREMKRNGIPMDKCISVNWLNEVDLNNIGLDAAKGLKRSTAVVGGSEHPLVQEIVKQLYDKGRGNGDRKHINDSYYNVGLAIYSTMFEGARAALKSDGGTLTPEKLRKGMESLRNFDANGFMAPLTVTAKDHGGGGKTRIEMWDGKKWVPQSDWFADYTDLVWQVVKEHSSEFAKSGK